MFLVSFVTSVSNPPITPASPTGLVPSVMTMSLLDNILSCPSNVVKCSPSVAILMVILLPNLSAS